MYVAPRLTVCSGAGHCCQGCLPCPRQLLCLRVVTCLPSRVRIPTPKPGLPLLYNSSQHEPPRLVSSSLLDLSLLLATVSSPPLLVLLLPFPLSVRSTAGALFWTPTGARSATWSAPRASWSGAGRFAQGLLAGARGLSVEVRRDGLFFGCLLSAVAPLCGCCCRCYCCCVLRVSPASRCCS